MILVLTYHKVMSGPESPPKFYTISSGEFERQLCWLERSGLEPLSPSTLLGAKLPEQGYLLTFDDGTLDHYEVVLPLLNRHKREGIFFVPTAKLNQPGFLTDDQAAGISRAGHTLGLHSHEHRRLDTMGEEDIRVQMEISRGRLRELSGSIPEFFAPVGGYVNGRVQRIAGESGVRVLRTMHWGYNKHLNLMALQCIPINRSFTEREFGNALKMRNRPLMYAFKQLSKSLMPGRAYELLRSIVLGRSERK